MAVLSLLARTPSPEPVDKDFYSEFGKKDTGSDIFYYSHIFLRKKKMQVGHQEYC